MHAIAEIDAPVGGGINESEFEELVGHAVGKVFPLPKGGLRERGEVEVREGVRGGGGG